MKRLLLVAVLVLPIPFAALPLVSVAIAFGGEESAPTLRAEVVPAPPTPVEHWKLAYSLGAQPDHICDMSPAGF